MKAQPIRTNADGSVTYDGCTECGRKDGHEARCPCRNITGRSRQTVEDPRFKRGVYVGNAAIDPRVARGRIEMRLIELPRHVSAGGLDPEEAAREIAFFRRKPDEHPV